jgi:hypothetical protein
LVLVICAAPWYGHESSKMSGGGQWLSKDVMMGKQVKLLDDSETRKPCEETAETANLTPEFTRTTIDSGDRRTRLVSQRRKNLIQTRTSGLLPAGMSSTRLK